MVAEQGGIVEVSSDCVCINDDDHQFNNNNISNLNNVVITNDEQPIKTRFQELPFEVLLHIMDYFFPFYSHFEKATREKSSNINFTDRRKSIMILSEVLHRVFSAPSFMLETRIVQCGGDAMLHFNSNQQVSYKYLNTNRDIDVRALALRQYIIDEVICEFYNLIRVSKRTFYSFLIEDCYDLLVVKLIWEGLHHCIRNPDLVLDNAMVDLEEIQPLPGSQYIISEPLYLYVLRSRLEPILFVRLFLSQPSFGFSNYVTWKLGKNVNLTNEITESDWSSFLDFIREQVTRYPLLKSGTKFSSRFQTEDFVFIKKCGFDTDSIVKLVYIDLDIPIGAVSTLKSIESPILWKAILERKGNNFSALEICEDGPLFLAVLKNLRLDILELIMQLQQENSSDLDSFFNGLLSPLYTLISACMYDDNFEEKSERIGRILKTMRRNFLPFLDIFTTPSSCLHLLISRTAEIFQFKLSFYYPTQYCKTVFQVFYRVFVEELEQSQYEILAAGLPSLVLQAVGVPFFFPILFDKSLPPYILTLHKRMLANPTDDIFGILLESYGAKPQQSISPLRTIFECVKENPFAFRDTLIQNNFAEKLNDFIQNIPQENNSIEISALKEILQDLNTLYN
ncbi:predicted protein [Naegleria gruberi]|uniref:Predicted protein n=1 Tax=Naegleria gruberi TaxID=5762 RepID=D2VYS8_NAEGR|nr:uncharacterized protein NAEGRDRAFT_59614 [Naegleria gruberi]EFC37962.1 predicted protein [Naegleria gruberi]|eukprot:XP_002670706.1 predicted protein [Naegleria gruberi strain NEG-M]